MRISPSFARVAAALLVLLAVAPVADAPVAAQSKTITLSMLAGYKEDVLRANLPEFEKKTGIKVVIDAAPFGDLYKKQLLSLSTGGRYDVMGRRRASRGATATRRCGSFGSTRGFAVGSSHIW